MLIGVCWRCWISVNQPFTSGQPMAWVFRKDISNVQNNIVSCYSYSILRVYSLLFYFSLIRFFQSLSLSERPPIKHWWSGKWRRVHCLATTLGIGFLSDRSARAWQRHLLCDDLSDNQYIRLPNLKHYQHFTLFTLITLNNLLFLVPHVYYKYQISVGKCLICILLLWFNEETNDC